MPRENLATWQQQELPLINQALSRAVRSLPSPCRPIAAHVLEAGGKRLRPLLTIACARLFSRTDASVYPLASSMELLHAATLLHDDVLDNADQRRGVASAHTLFGVSSTILAGDALLAHGNSIVASYQIPELVECYSLATTGTAAGEILEIASIRNPNLDPARYLEIARGKTGCLIAQACLLGAVYGGAAQIQKEQCLCFGENLGVAFQIIDDALDFMPNGRTGKPCGGDLREGKMTPPLYFYRRSLSEEAREAFDEHFIHDSFSPGQLDQITTAVASFTEEGSSLADGCLQRARSALAGLPSGFYRDILGSMIDYVRSRKM